MKKVLILILLVLGCSGSVFGGEFEDTLKKAEKGSPGAQWLVGYAYDVGKGVAQDYKKALFWYKKAFHSHKKRADQGDLNSQCSLGYAYYYGQGIAQDYKKALFWFKKAAEQGDAIAQNSLGIIYDRGEGGIAQDSKQAVSWWEKAAKLGNLEAQIQLGYLYFYGKGIYNLQIPL